MNIDRTNNPPFSGREEEADYVAPVFKTFIESPGQLLADSLGEYFDEKLDNRDCDLKFFCSDSRFVRVHRALFSAISPFLRKLFLELDPFQSKELNILLPDIRYIDLKHLVTFVYRGEVFLTKRVRGTLVKWLEILGISLVLNETVCNNGNENSLVVVNDSNSSSKLIYICDEYKRHRTEKLMCQLCKKSFKTESYMKSHLLTHTGEKPHTCTFCGKKFRYKDSLKAHMRDHTGDKLKCQFKSCDKEFNRMRDLKDHENSHRQSVENLQITFSCDVCDAKFLRKKQLSNHKEVHREIVGPCTICGKILKNVACLRAHMKNHNSPKTFSCGTCGKAFKRNFDLTVHLRIHSGSKPYKCVICRKTFSLSSTLAKHKRFHEKLLKRKGEERSDESNTNYPSCDANALKNKGEFSYIRPSKQSHTAKETAVLCMTQNTVADALIDLSQSSNVVLVRGDSCCSDSEHVLME